MLELFDHIHAFLEAELEVPLNRNALSEHLDKLGARYATCSAQAWEAHDEISGEHFYALAQQCYGYARLIRYLEDKL